MKNSHSEIASLFRAFEGLPSNAGEEVYPGYPGAVIAGGEVRSMVWGFPLSIKGKSGKMLKPKPVNNARTDKLDGGFWKASFRDRRCLIPVSSFAEAEGPKGGKTRTWFTLPDQPLFACAGIWRDSAEWGPSFSMIMADANETVQPTHDRMPVIVAPARWAKWVNGDEGEAKALCQPYEGAMEVDRTAEPWVRSKAS